MIPMLFFKAFLLWIYELVYMQKILGNYDKILRVVSTGRRGYRIDQLEPIVFLFN